MRIFEKFISCHSLFVKRTGRIRLFHWYSTFTQTDVAPVTAPIPLRPKLNPGDLIVIQRFNGNCYLGVIDMRVARNSDAIYELVYVYSREDGFRLVNPNYIRFHHPNFIPVAGGDPTMKSSVVNAKVRFDDRHSMNLSILPSGKSSIESSMEPNAVAYQLDQLELRARAIIRKKFRDFRLVIDKARDKSGAQALLYEDKVSQLVFNDGLIGAPERLATHLVLFSDTQNVAKDGLFRIGGPYYARSLEERNLLAKVAAIISKTPEHLRRFQSKFESLSTSPALVASLHFSDIERLFIQVLHHYAHSHYNNLHQSPFLPLIKQITWGICPIEPNEVRVFLELHNLLSILDVPVLQSGLHRPIEAKMIPTHNVGLAQSPPTSSPSFVHDNKRVIIDRPCIAIDAPTTIEVDDAVDAVENADGTIWLHIHIADPATLISVESEVDRAARNAASTLYLPSGHLPMLPGNIGKKASLTPNQPNLAITFSAKVNDRGEIVDYRVEPAIVTNLYRLTYEEATRQLTSPNEPHSHTLTILHKVSEWRASKRLRDGWIKFEIPKPQPTVIENKVTAFCILPDKAIKLASDLVSEAMITAGQVAALKAIEYQVPIPFRYHNIPDNFPLESGQTYGLFEMLQARKALEASAVDVIPRRHTIMGISSYSKVTSPLRRYFDLLAHHQLYPILAGKEVGRKPLSVDEMRAILPSVYQHERYLKRLQVQSTRYWTLMFLQAQLKDAIERMEPYFLDVMYLEHFPHNGNAALWISKLALIVYANIGPVYKLHAPGNVFRVRILNVNLVKLSIDFAPLPEAC